MQTLKHEHILAYFACILILALSGMPRRPEKSLTANKLYWLLNCNSLVSTVVRQKYLPVQGQLLVAVMLFKSLSNQCTIKAWGTVPDKPSLKLNFYQQNEDILNQIIHPKYHINYCFLDESNRFV